MDLETWAPNMDDSSSASNDDENTNNDTFSTRVHELWTLATGKSLSLTKELNDLLQSVENTLVYYMFNKQRDKPPPLSTIISPPVVQKLVETSMRLINCGVNECDNSETRYKYQTLAIRILISIPLGFVDCDQTKLVFNGLIGELQTKPADDNEPVSTELIALSAYCLSRLDYEHVLTREQAADLIKELSQVASRALEAELSHLDPYEKYLLVDSSDYHALIDYIPRDRQVNYIYRALITFLLSLVNHSGQTEYYEYAKTVFQETKSGGAVNSGTLVMINLLLAANSRSRCNGTFYSPHEELVQITMKLICISTGFYRGHLIYLLWQTLDGVEYYNNTVERSDMTETLVNQFVSRDDDQMADLMILDVLHMNNLFVNLRPYFAGKERAIKNKIDIRPIYGDYFTPYLSAGLTDAEPEL